MGLWSQTLKPFETESAGTMIDQVPKSKGTAHDVKGLLVRAGLALEMLEKNECEKVRKHVFRVSRAFEQLAELCLREFDKGREWSFRLDYFDAQDVKRSLREVVDVARMKSNQLRSNIQFRIHVDPNVHISVDRLTFFRAMFNLVNISTEAIHKSRGTQVTVSAHADNQRVWIDVSDDGPGLPPEVSKAFTSSDQPTENDPASQMTGLRTARDLIKMLNGSLSLLATGPTGTIFRVSMPVVELAIDPLIPHKVPIACNSPAAHVCR